MNIWDPTGPWCDEPRGILDVLRCLMGRHRAVNSEIIDHSPVMRCSCGSIWVAGGWVNVDGWGGIWRLRRRSEVSE